jgi:hypothetical protein
MPSFGNSEGCVVFVYGVMEEFGLFLPLDKAPMGAPPGVADAEIPERTLVPLMLQTEEPGDGNKWSRTAISDKNRGSCRERVFLFQLRGAPDSESGEVSGGGDGVRRGVRGEDSSRFLTLHGLLQGFVVRTTGCVNYGSTSEWDETQSSFWSNGWRGKHRLIDDAHVWISLNPQTRELTLRVICAPPYSGAKLMEDLVDRLLALVRREWPGVVPLKSWSCMCMPTCTCKVAPDQVSHFRALTTFYKCTCDRAPEHPLDWFDDGVASAVAM